MSNENKLDILKPFGPSIGITNLPKNLNITSDGFEIEPEITAKISKIKDLKIYEVPISISSRSYEEGKKVRWWHFFTYVYHLLKWRITS